MRDKFPVDVVLAIYSLVESSGGLIEPKCGFLRGEDNKLYLPSTGLPHNKYASQVIVDMTKQLIKRNIKDVDIIPLDFLDPMNEEKRIITLAYKVMIQSPTPIYANIEFLNYEELRRNELAKKRDAIIFRRGFSS